jgi:hypothetical protein
MSAIAHDQFTCGHLVRLILHNLIKIDLVLWHDSYIPLHRSKDTESHTTT